MDLVNLCGSGCDLIQRQQMHSDIRDYFYSGEIKQVMRGRSQDTCKFTFILIYDIHVIGFLKIAEADSAVFEKIYRGIRND